MSTRITLSEHLVSSDWQDWFSKHVPDLNPRYVTDGAYVFQFSRYVRQTAERHPNLLTELIHRGVLATEFEPAGANANLFLPDISASEADFMAQIRVFRTFHMLWIYWRDLSGNADLSETCAHVSWLADSCLEMAHAWAYSAVSQQFALTDNSLKPLIIIGMGKYGSEELNVSSDIDLIFCYTAAQDIPSSVRSLEIFYTRLGQLIIKLLDTRTAAGFVFRVDMRLRPYGDSGALVMSDTALESYYLEQGRDWERFALVKGRFVVATEQQRRDLYAILKPFVFRRYIDFSVLESPREMKRLIQHEIRRRNLGDNIKLGAGGIREIEFITQTLQLIHGGKDPKLQGRELLAMLDRIAEAGLLESDTVRQLTNAYTFLRLLEHRLQAYKDEQTQVIPSDETRQELLALSMGFSDWRQCKKALEQHRQAVHHIFNGLFAGSEQGNAESIDVIYSDIWLTAYKGGNVESVIAQTELEQVTGIGQILKQFAGLNVVQNCPSRAEQMLHHLVPTILAELHNFDDGRLLFQRMIDLLLAIISRTAYLELLKENTNVLKHVMMLCDRSSLVADNLADYPFIMDELINPVMLTSDSVDEFNEQLKQSLNRIPLDDIEARMNVLREIRQIQLFRLSIADISGVMDTPVISEFLSDMAVSVIQETANMAWQLMVERHGTLPSLDSSVESTTPGFCIVAYGKLGSREMSYSSDLDLVFLYRSHNETSTGPAAIDNKRFYIRLAQKIIHLLNTRTRTGVLYEVDMRLRPSGNSGLLVTDIDAFNEYQSTEAWTWEHQALVRARSICGDTELAAQFDTIRTTVLSRQREPAELKQDILQMRTRMREHTMEKLKPGEIDLKQSAGGLADIEFLTQYLVLQNSWKYPELLLTTSTTKLLKAIANTGSLSQSNLAMLLEQFLTIRTLLHQRSLQKLQGVISADDDLTQKFTDVVSQWDAVFHRSD